MKGGNGNGRTTPKFAGTMIDRSAGIRPGPTRAGRGDCTPTHTHTDTKRFLYLFRIVSNKLDVLTLKQTTE